MGKVLFRLEKAFQPDSAKFREFAERFERHGLGEISREGEAVAVESLGSCENVALNFAFMLELSFGRSVVFNEVRCRKRGAGACEFTVGEAEE